MRHHFVRSSAGLRDPNFKNVTLLLHGDGTNGGQNNTFLDSSASNNAITRTGNVAQGSFSPYGDRWSNYFDGTGDGLSIADNAAFTLGSGDFTLEAWVYLQSSAIQIIAGQNSGSVNTSSIDIRYNAGTLSGNAFVGSASYTISGSASQNTWNHVAFVRDGATLRLFLNGSQLSTGSIGTNSINDSASAFTVGQAAIAGYSVTGYISNARLIKGTAVYTSNFTPPTTPLTAITNTSLLTCQSNRFRDASTNNFTITRNGDVSVQRFSPFGPDTLYRTDRIAGSAYFDGTGDWLQVANRGLKLTAGFFTAECWVYITTYPASFFYALFEDRYWQGGSNGGWCIFINTAGQIVMQASSGIWNSWGGTFITSSNSIIRGQWNHVAVVRGANDLINIYINGISTTTPVAKKDLNLNSGSAQSAWESRIGIHASDIVFGGSYNYPLPGTISDLRVINGKCLYTANFTPPTEPLTAIPETTFLGRFANASIVDNAMMNNLETVGNAQISTSVKKYGTGSLYFDGTGDWLRTRNTPELAFGTGDFSIECWFYIAGNSSLNPSNERKCSLVSQLRTTSATGIAIEIRGNSTTTGTGIEFSNFVSGISSTIGVNTTIAQSTWHHVAVVRSGTTTTIYLNGSSVASGTLSSQTINPIDDLTVGANGLHTTYPHVLNGYIDDFRITKGIARYTSNFTPPTAPFPDF